MQVSRKYGLTMVLVIGGVGINDVYDLGEHAEKIGVDGIVLLPDLFYKPRIEEDLVEYFKLITKYITRVPLYYYHIPEYTNVKCKSPKFEILFPSAILMPFMFYFFRSAQCTCHVSLTWFRNMWTISVEFCMATLTSLWPKNYWETVIMWSLPMKLCCSVWNPLALTHSLSLGVCVLLLICFDVRSIMMT